MRKVCELGRSMVEMLGVLAIIGVLSVGGISGYSKAMFKHKMNKQMEQLNTIISSITRFKHELKRSSPDGSYIEVIPILKKMGEIPEDMYIENNDRYIQDVFKTRYQAYYQLAGGDFVGMYDTTHTTAMNNFIDMCKNAHLIAKDWRQELSLIQILDTNLKSIYQLYGDKRCDTSKKCLKNLKITDIDDLCRMCEEEDWCGFYFIWHVKD